MSAEEETAAQRQARIRQQKREAKIKGSAQERLDKITSLSGRSAETSEIPSILLTQYADYRSEHVVADSISYASIEFYTSGC